MTHRARVVTVTPNPSLDLLFETDRALVWDDANRMADPRRRPGGQGINVARALRELGGDALAIALLGGRTGAEIERTLLAEGTPLRVVAGADETRTFVAVREHPQQRSLLLNARGPTRTPADQEALFRATIDAVAESAPSWLACCGSLPPGFDAHFYRALARAARDTGARVVVDCDGDALHAAAGLCDLLVPNQHEAERLTGLSVRDTDDALDAVRALPSPIAAVTLGARGAVLRRAGQIWLATPERSIDATSVGAGDCFLAALLLALADADDPARALRLATAAATASLLSEGQRVMKREDAARLAAGVQVRQVA